MSQLLAKSFTLGTAVQASQLQTARAKQKLINDIQRILQLWPSTLVPPGHALNALAQISQLSTIPQDYQAKLKIRINNLLLQDLRCRIDQCANRPELLDFAQQLYLYSAHLPLTKKSIVSLLIKRLAVFAPRDPLINKSPSLELWSELVQEVHKSPVAVRRKTDLDLACVPVRKQKIVIFGGHQKLKYMVTKALAPDYQLVWFCTDIGATEIQTRLNTVAGAALVVMVTGYAAHKYSELARKACRAHDLPLHYANKGGAQALVHYIQAMLTVSPDHKVNV